MAKKPDLSGVKDFFFKYGERVALFACMGIAVLLIVSGLMGAVGPGTPTGKGWDETIALAAKDLKNKLPLGGDPNPDNVKQYSKTEPFNWQQVDTRAIPSPYWISNENFDTRRTNPLILGILPDIDDVQNIQLDYLYRGHLGHEVFRNTVMTVAGGGAADKGGGNGIPGGGIQGGMKDGGGAGLNLATVLKPRHMLVVTAIFPMKAQVDEFLKALRITSTSELQFNKELPHILGINVFREEFVPGAAKATLKELIVFQKDQLTIDPKLDTDMQQAIYNTSNPKSLRPLIHEGLVTPLPNLPEGLKYPALRIKSDYWPKADMFAADDAMPANPAGGGVGMPPGGGLPKGPGILGKNNGDKGNPMGGADGPAEAKTEFVPLKKLAEKDKEIYDRLTGTYNIFHPYGQFTDVKDPPAAGNVERFGFPEPGEGNAGAAAGQAQPGEKMGSGKPPGGMKDKLGDKVGANPGAGVKGSLEIYDALARFVDVDVKPGCTYTYHIQVRVLNPNFNKPELVAQQNWSAIKELVSGWTSTKPFTVPDTYHLFAMDQFLVDKLGIANPKDLFQLEKMHGNAIRDGKAMFQLQRWIDKGGPQLDLLVSDWAINEVVAVNKGAPIGHTNMIVKIPTWNKGRGAFEMRSTPQGKGSVPGVSIDFVPPSMTADGKRIDGVAPLLVDFEGGQKKGAKLGLNVIEETAMEALILTPDGRLIVHNSRADMEAKIKDGTDEGTTRQKRVVEWRERNDAALNPSAPPAKKGGIIPGGG